MATAIDDDTGANSLWRKDRDHFLHPWTHFDSFKRDGSLVIREAEGAYVTDAAGQALSRRDRRIVVREHRLRPREMAQAIARAGAQAELLEHLHRLHQRAGGGARGQARRVGAGIAQSRGLFDVGILRERHRRSPRSLLSLAARRARAARDSVAATTPTMAPPTSA